MGDHSTSIETTREKKAAFIGHLLQDIQALEMMLEKGMIEDDIIRIGAEQEFYVINENWRPSTASDYILKNINDDHFTTELARFNLEINLDPYEFKGGCFRELEKTLHKLLTRADELAKENKTRVLLTGILPTISKHELDIDFMTPIPRYFALNDTIRALRGEDFELHIRGVDELAIKHESVLFEACTTSFQTHLQIHPDDFIKSFNWAQAIAGPVLGVCANSPLLLGRELWAETRIALFQQSVDTRSSSYALKDQRPRVTFGYAWAEGSIAEIFKNDIASHPILLTKQIEEDSLIELKEGRIPKLSALMLHNGTMYHWNRACYGVGNNKPHVRIENRYIPSGPTIMDEVANFAFWAGLMYGRPKKYNDIHLNMDFRDAKANFIKAARNGMEAVMCWNDTEINIKDLILQEMLPIAYDGLRAAKIDEKDIKHYLRIIEQRVNGHTGSKWIVQNMRRLRPGRKKEDVLRMITKSIFYNQHSGVPVHGWKNVDPKLELHEASHLVAHIMSTELFTVKFDDLAELATSVMEWKNVHHLPVEDKNGTLSGLLTWTHMQKFKKEEGNFSDLLVSDIMAKDLITVRPNTEISTAINLMKKNQIGCLPVVEDRHLVGIITINDIKMYDQNQSL